MKVQLRLLHILYKILIEKNPKNFKSKFKSRLKSPSSEKDILCNIICLNELNIVS